MKNMSINNKKISMFCAKCQKEQEKLGFFDSDSSSFLDGYFYCKSCFMKIFNQLPEKKKGEFAFYGKRTINDSTTDRRKD